MTKTNPWTRKYKKSDERFILANDDKPLSYLKRKLHRFSSRSITNKRYRLRNGLK